MRRLVRETQPIHRHYSGTVAGSIDGGYTCPVTCVAIEYTFVGSAINENPVMAVAAIGLTPMLPTMSVENQVTGVAF